MNRPYITLPYSAEHPELQMDLVLPPEEAGPPPPQGWPVVVWLHGGGWRLMDRKACPDLTTHFAGAGFAMASIDYRLAPAHRHPAQLHDLRQAIRFLHARGPELGLDPEGIGLWGSSAGGHVATLGALLGSQRRLEDEHVDRDAASISTNVVCVVQGYAPAALDLLLPEFRAPNASGHELDLPASGAPATTPEQDLLGGPARDRSGHQNLLDAARRASPVHTLPPGTPPPFLMMHGTDDRLVPPEQSMLLHEHLVRHGGQSDLYLLEGFGHGFFNPGQVKELGPGTRLDNGRLEREPAPRHALLRSPASTFSPEARAPSMDTIREFFAHHLMVHWTSEKERT